MMKDNYIAIKADAREKALEHGIETLFDSELISLILGTGTKENPVESLSCRVLTLLDDMDTSSLMEALLKIKGMGVGKSLALVAALELGRRRSGHLKAPILKPLDLVPFVRNYAVSSKEHFIVVTLNGGHEIIEIHVASVGTINRSLVHAREVFSQAIKENAAAIILCHNHPSGNCHPSTEDIDSTATLLAAANVIGIPILDHIIVDCEGYYSFLENNLLFCEE